MFYLAKIVYNSQISLVMMNLSSSFVINKTQINYTGRAGVKANYTNFNIKFTETYYSEINQFIKVVEFNKPNKFALKTI